MTRDSLPGCQRLNPGYDELDSSEGTAHSSFLLSLPKASFSDPPEELIERPS